MKLEIWLTNKNVLIVVDGRLVEYDEGIKLIRQEKGWTRKELAHKLGVSNRTIEGWESGRCKNPNKTSLILLKYIL